MQIIETRRGESKQGASYTNRPRSGRRSQVNRSVSRYLSSIVRSALIWLMSTARIARQRQVAIKPPPERHLLRATGMTGESVRPRRCGPAAYTRYLQCVGGPTRVMLQAWRSGV
jgi:hypothetical protein